MKSKLTAFNSLEGAVNVDIFILKIRSLLGTRNEDNLFQGTIFEILGQIEGLVKTIGLVDMAREGSRTVIQGLLKTDMLPYKPAIEDLKAHMFEVCIKDRLEASQETNLTGITWDL